MQAKHIHDGKLVVDDKVNTALGQFLDCAKEHGEALHLLLDLVLAHVDGRLVVLLVAVHGTPTEVLYCVPFGVVTAKEKEEEKEKHTVTYTHT